MLGTNLHGWEPSARFIEAVAQVESGGDPDAIGDNGKALGTYQFHEDAWADTSSIIKRLGGVVYPYSSATNEAISRLYFTALTMDIAKRLKKDKIKPTDAVVYMCYTMGYAGAKKIRFRIDNAPIKKQSSIQRVINLSK